MRNVVSNYTTIEGFLLSYIGVFSHLLHFMYRIKPVMKSGIVLRKTFYTPVTNKMRRITVYRCLSVRRNLHVQ
jgi:hypothetical protein